REEGLFMRAVLLASLFLVPSTAFAEEFALSLSVTSAEVFPDSARVTAEARGDLPAGAHEIVVLVPPDMLAGSAFTPEVAGATLTGTQISRNGRFDPSDFDMAIQAEARRALEEAERSLDAAQRALRTAEEQIAALAAADDFLARVTLGDGPPVPGQIAALAETIATEIAANAERRTTLASELPPLQDALFDARERRARAETALDALFAPSGDWALVTLSVDVPAAGPVVLRADYLDFSANWQVEYDVRLADGGLTLGRSVAVERGLGLPWIEAMLTLSTAQPQGQTRARDVNRSIARIVDPEAPNLIIGRAIGTAGMEADTVPGVMAAAPRMVEASFDGPVVEYRLPDPVTLLTGGRQLLALDTLELAAEEYLAAAPRFDDTAFLMVDATNESGETILPGLARLFREDTLVREEPLPLIAAGDMVTLGFGPELSVGLDVEFLDQQEGDRGIIRGQNTREDEIRLTATNLGEAAQDVRLRYAVPTSQQEDLVIAVDMSPAPTTQDADDLLGVMEWELTLSPGETTEIALAFDLRWPEGQVLNWRP
ncbi:MAG: DUF4139 domain-containing protein, partial [Pseudomonadota bacterium]